jgi:hypothetical protein
MPESVGFPGNCVCYVKERQMNYYFDSIDGDNSRAGHAPDEAWKGFDPLLAERLAPGDRILLRRGSHFRQQLRVSAVGREDAWIEITAYGEGPRPVVESGLVGECGEINHTGTLDESAACIYVDEAAHLRISHITVYNSYYGLLINNHVDDHRGIVIEDVLAVQIQNFGQESPRVNSSGIEVVVGRGRECSNVTLRDVAIRRCECYRTGTGFSVRAYGDGCAVEGVQLEKITSHHHANTPWSYVGLFLRGVRDAVCDGVCLDRCAPHWKSTGTATVHYVRSDRVVFRNGYIGHTQDTDSHDMGGWDFEAGGRDCLIENSTFDHNAGPAIEYLRCENTAQEVEVSGCTFIGNDHTLWGGANVLHIGRSGPDPTGSVHDNHYVLAPGTEFGGHDFFRMQNNHEYADASDVSDHVQPPEVDAGADRTITGLQTRLGGSVSNAIEWRWEAVIAPAAVTFEDPKSLNTTVRFSRPGNYVLRLAAENDHLRYGDYLTIRCVEDPEKDLLARWSGVEKQPEAVDLGEKFTITCRIRPTCPAQGKQLILCNSAEGDPIDGFRLCLDRRPGSEGTLLLETGDGENRDTAYSYPGALSPDKNLLHHLAVTFDCTSRDGRGTARIILDGRDVTLFGGIQSTMGACGPMRFGTVPTDLPGRATRCCAGTSPPSHLDVPADFQLAFEDQFDGDLKENWEVLSGAWRTADGRLMVDGKGEIRCCQKFASDVLVLYEACTDNPSPCDLSATLNALPESGTMHGYFFGFGTDGNAGGRFMRRTGPVAEYEACITPIGVDLDEQQNQGSLDCLQIEPGLLPALQLPLSYAFIVEFLAVHTPEKKMSRNGANRMLEGTMVNRILESMPDRRMAREIRAAKERVLLAAPAVTSTVAEALMDAISAIGRENVSVTLDCSEEVIRMGYGTLEAVEHLMKSGGTIRQCDGLRTGLLIRDERAWHYCPTALAVSDFGGSNAVRISSDGAAELIRSIAWDVDQASKQRTTSCVQETVQSEYGIDAALEPLTLSKLDSVKRKLEAAPPLAPTAARQVRRFSSCAQHVQIELTGCAIQRQRVRVPEELEGLAPESELRGRLHTSFEPFERRNDLSSKPLEDELRRIRREYAPHLGRPWGRLILRRRRPAFEEEIAAFRGRLRAYRQTAERKLARHIAAARQQVADHYLSAALSDPPDALWTYALGHPPNETQAREWLEATLDTALPDPAELVEHMRLEVQFHNVSWDTLQDAKFFDVLRDTFPEDPWNRLLRNLPAARCRGEQAELFDD